VASALDGAALSELKIRRAEPADHARVLAVLDEWWGGRRMGDMLPRLFFVHFRETSFVAERDGDLAGFLVGFLSAAEPEEAYVHFVGVSPVERGNGLGRELYERFFELARAGGRTRVTCVTSPVNTGSLAFHTAIGFEASPPQAGYDGPGEDRVVLTRSLEPAPLWVPGARRAS
jgi:predicted GNAT superfamily acetyltransferase